MCKTYKIPQEFIAKEKTQLSSVATFVVPLRFLEKSNFTKYLPDGSKYREGLSVHAETGHIIIHTRIHKDSSSVSISDYYLMDYTREGLTPEETFKQLLEEGVPLSYPVMDDQGRIPIPLKVCDQAGIHPFDIVYLYLVDKDTIFILKDEN